MLLGKPTQNGVRRRGDHALRQGDDAMVHLLHHEAMQIDKVAADIQFGDLPSAIRECRIASREAAGEQSAVLRPRALPDDVGPGGDALQWPQHLTKRRRFFRRQSIPAAQLFDQTVQNHPTTA